MHTCDPRFWNLLGFSRRVWYRVYFACLGFRKYRCDNNEIWAQSGKIGAEDLVSAPFSFPVRSQGADRRANCQPWYGGESGELLASPRQLHPASSVPAAALTHTCTADRGISHEFKTWGRRKKEVTISLKTYVFEHLIVVGFLGLFFFFTNYTPQRGALAKLSALFFLPGVICDGQSVCEMIFFE